MWGYAGMDGPTVGQGRGGQLIIYSFEMFICLAVLLKFTLFTFIQ